jgi:hypothetical protein
MVAVLAENLPCYDRDVEWRSLCTLLYDDCLKTRYLGLFLQLCPNTVTYCWPDRRDPRGTAYGD